MTKLEQISHNFMRFMRGKYRLDEIGDGKDELKFKQGTKTILTVYTHEDKFTFLVIFGKKEREIFDAQRDNFSEWMQGQYDGANTYHDGKWIFIDVTEPQQLVEIKRMIMIKKKPNRKPLPREGAIYGKCGHRCDMCIHYSGLNEEVRAEIVPKLDRIYDDADWSMRCGGCMSETWYRRDDDEPCEQMVCAVGRGLDACVDCPEYPCFDATVSDRMSMIHTKVIYADDVTWGILPYVPRQYENVE